LTAEEWLENPLAIFVWYARTTVLDHELHFAVGCDPDRYVDGCIRRRVLNGVLKQVGEHAFELACLHAHGDRLRRHAPSQLAVRQQAADPVDRAVYD